MAIPMISKSALTESTWIVIGQFAAAAGSVAVVRITTNSLTPSAYGELALAATVATLVNQVVMGGLVASVGRFYSIAREENALAQFLFCAKRIVLINAVAIACAFTALASFLWFTNDHRWVMQAALATAFAILSGFTAILNSLQAAARRRAYVAIHASLDVWLRALISLVLLTVLHGSAVVVLTAFTIAAMVTVTSQLAFSLRGDADDRIDRSDYTWDQRIWSYSWPFASWGLFTFAQLTSDRWALATWTTTTDVGRYAALYQIGNYPITLLCGLTTTFLAPIIYERSGNASDKRRNSSVSRIVFKITAACLGLTTAGVVSSLIFHEQVFHLLTSKDYVHASYLLPWVVLAAGLFAAGQLLTLRLLAEMKSHEMITNKISTAIFGVIGNCLGAKYFGLPGVVGAAVAFSIVYFGWTLQLIAAERVADEPALSTRS